MFISICLKNYFRFICFCLSSSNRVKLQVPWMPPIMLLSIKSLKPSRDFCKFPSSSFRGSRFQTRILTVFKIVTPWVISINESSYYDFCNGASDCVRLIDGACSWLSMGIVQVYLSVGNYFQIFIFSECRTSLTEGDLKRLFIHNVTSIYIIIYFKCVK